mgnify:CR=1 FL=1
MTAFEGFPQETFDFLEGLTDNNSKIWFDRHRKEYQAHYMTPAKLFVEAMGERLGAMDPHISAVPQVNKSIFRINRDVRFSKDKTPYRNHIDLLFYEGTGRRSGSGFFFRLLSDRVILGAGIHQFDTNGLKKFRAAVVRDGEALRISGILEALKNQGYEVGEAHYKTVPPGYGDRKDNDLLKYNSLHASCETAVSDLSDLIRSADFSDWCADHYERLQPLHRWLSDYVSEHTG